MSTPQLVTTCDDLAARVAAEHAAGNRVALVPTMGALHEGHIELVRHAAKHADTVVVSVFVNPTQFGAGEDFGRYPRTLDADIDACADADVDVVFAPDVTEMYDSRAIITVEPGPLGDELEGASRPGHFRGVLTIVAKLLNVADADVAVFGEKDYQQLTLIRAMVNDLKMRTRIEACPTVRESTGLAMSSRNRYLSAEESHAARVIPAALRAAEDVAHLGHRTARAAAADVLAGAPGVDVDYLELRGTDLGAHQPNPRETRLLVAARVGTTRLIDNVHLHHR